MSQNVYAMSFLSPPSVSAMSKLFLEYRAIYSYQPQGGILDFFRIFHGWIPILDDPRPVSFSAGMTIVVLLAVSMMENTPVFGLKDTSFDNLFWLRGWIFSTRGSVCRLRICLTLSCWNWEYCPSRSILWLLNFWIWWIFWTLLQRSELHLG